MNFWRKTLIGSTIVAVLGCAGAVSYTLYMDIGNKYEVSSPIVRNYNKVKRDLYNLGYTKESLEREASREIEIHYENPQIKENLDIFYAKQKQFKESLHSLDKITEILENEISKMENNQEIMENNQEIINYKNKKGKIESIIGFFLEMMILGLGGTFISGEKHRKYYDILNKK